MKYLLSIIIVFFITGFLNAQKVAVKSVIVKRELPGDVSTWGADAVNIVGQSTSAQGGSEAKLVVKIGQGGNGICGNKPQTATLEAITTRVYTSRDIIAMIGACQLPPGNYTLCAQYFNIENFAIGDPLCKEFVVPEIKKVDVVYRRPELVSPENNANLSIDDLKKPLTFRYSSIIPYNIDIVYTVRIYSIEKGQEPSQAIKNSRPVFEKEVKTTQTTWLIPSEYIMDPEDKSFAWNVQANSKDGKGYGPNNGLSDYFIFNLRRPSCKNFKVNFIKNNSERYKNGCCYDLSLNNTYNVSSSNSPKSFRITSNNSSIISATDAPSGWNRTPATVPPNTNSITWVKTVGYIPTGQTNLNTLCFGNTTGLPFYVRIEWLNGSGKIICKDSVRISCKKDSNTKKCCRYALYLTNNASNSFFKEIRITPLGTTRITEASSDGDIWLQANDLNYTYVKYSNPSNSTIPLIPVEEEDIWFSIDPTSSSTPKVLVEWIGLTNNILATHTISLPCYEEKNINDDIDWDSYTQITTGSQYNVFSGIDQVPCSEPIYLRSMEDCPEILHLLSCDASNNTILTITRSDVSNPYFKWIIDGVDRGNAYPLIINPAPNSSYAVQLIQSQKYTDINGQDSFAIDCTNEKLIKIHRPNPGFSYLQIGQPCPNFNIAFTYYDPSNLLDLLTWTYSWTFKLGGVVVGNGTGPATARSFTNEGTYDVIIEVTTDWGCKYSDTAQIILSYECKPKLDWSYDWCNDTGIRAGQRYLKTVTFENLSTGGKCPTFEIKFPGAGWQPFIPGMTKVFNTLPNETWQVDFKMTSTAAGAAPPCGIAISNSIVLKPLQVDINYTLCPNGDVIFNTPSPNPTWEFPGANNQTIFTLLNKNESTVTPNYEPGKHLIILNCYDPNTHAKCRKDLSFETIDICCDDQKSLQPFTNTLNGNNYKIRGKFKVKYKHLFDWSGVGPFNKHTKVEVKTIAFKEKRKRNGNTRWKRFHPEQIYAGLEGDFYNRGAACDCDNLNHYNQNGDPTWDWWVRGVRFRDNLYAGGTNYIRWDSVKSIHGLKVSGAPMWYVNIYLGQLDCDH